MCEVQRMVFSIEKQNKNFDSSGFTVKATTFYWY